MIAKLYIAREDTKGLWKLTVAGSWMNWVESWFAAHQKEDRVNSWFQPNGLFSKIRITHQSIRE